MQCHHDATPASALASRTATRLRVASVGYLVDGKGTGRVHSVFRNACNVVSGDAITTIVTAGSGDGPALLRLACSSPIDLRAHFHPGEHCAFESGVARFERTTVDWSQARIWRAPAVRPRVDDEQVRLNLALARSTNAIYRAARPSVIGAMARAHILGLEEASRRCDAEATTAHLARLIGWGEGLTPAGDDFIVGWLAGLHALATPVARRRVFIVRVADQIRSGLAATTKLSAHILQLATAGHFASDLHAARVQLLAASTATVLVDALERALQVGATSGVDTVSGLLMAFDAWLDQSLHRAPAS